MCTVTCVVMHMAVCHGVHLMTICFNKTVIESAHTKKYHNSHSNWRPKYMFWPKTLITILSRINALLIYMYLCLDYFFKCWFSKAFLSSSHCHFLNFLMTVLSVHLHWYLEKVLVDMYIYQCIYLLFFITTYFSFYELYSIHSLKPLAIRKVNHIQVYISKYNNIHVEIIQVAQP